MSNKNPEIVLERTLAIFKQDAWKKEVPLIDIFMEEGITITNKRYVKLSPEQAMEFYKHQKHREDFTRLIEDLSCGIILVMVLCQDGITETWKKIVNFKKSKEADNEMAQKFWNILGRQKNNYLFHASESKAEAAREIRFFFPDTVIEPLMTKRAAQDYLAEKVNPTLLAGLTEVCKRKPKDPVVCFHQLHRLTYSKTLII
uniref:NDK domain-containing protein n=1 Tax=Mesocestoides corti TaxID=53468 RepID=A0A5K3FIF2_MESCO